MIIDFNTIVGKLCEGEITYIELRPSEAAVIQKLMDAANRFFLLDPYYKTQVEAGASHNGYRKAGQEYSQTEERPDLNESYWYRDVPLGREENYVEHELRPLMKEVTEAFAWYADKILTSIAQIPGFKNTSLVDFREFSWSQVNRYEPLEAAKQGREFLQEKHDDGHLLTFALSSAYGLECFRPSEDYATPILPSLARICIMPGHAMERLTDGKIKAVFHQVRTHPDYAYRNSFTYFVNPNPSKELKPWAGDECVDVAKIAQEFPLQHGLPKV